jgi:hypothetical protein
MTDIVPGLTRINLGDTYPQKERVMRFLNIS